MAEFPEGPTILGQITALGRNAIVEHRNDHGSVTRKVLAGSDPLGVTTPNRAFRLLHFSFAPVPLAESKGLNPDSIEIFATTDQALDSTSGEALLSRLHELIPLREITVYVRRDTWFVDIPGYPLAYPFQVEQAPPTREAFLQSSTLVCGGLENPINSAAK
ncbi:MAG: hypothetical protein DMG58_24810 [Acidobacteria bacterium]|nr:MAG: hypothetical protein DMG58_24810 [Acidobacteriota bacterium]